jgi:hypothetical protein
MPHMILIGREEEARGDHNDLGTWTLQKLIMIIKHEILMPIKLEQRKYPGCATAYLKWSFNWGAPLGITVEFCGFWSWGSWSFRFDGRGEKSSPMIIWRRKILLLASAEMLKYYLLFCKLHEVIFFVTYHYFLTTMNEIQRNGNSSYWRNPGVYLFYAKLRVPKVAW